MGNYKGVGTALVTPFKDGQVDYVSLEKLVKHNIDGGVNHLVIMGTTGESVNVSKVEQEKILKSVIDWNHGNCSIVLGVGGNSTFNTLSLMEEWSKVEEIDAFLSVSPYYNKPTQEGIFVHYSALASSTDKDIIVYNVPGRTASNVLPETVIALADEFDNIAAVKEASGDLEQMMALITGRPKGFDILSGDDALVLPQMSLGCDGVISVVSNAFPKEFVGMVNAANIGEYAKARKLHYLVYPLISSLFKEGNPGGIKAALKYLKITSEEDMRLPLVGISDELRKEIKENSALILKD